MELEFISIELVIVLKCYCNVYFVILYMVKLSIHIICCEFVNLKCMTMCYCLRLCVVVYFLQCVAIYVLSVVVNENVMFMICCCL